MTLLKYMRNLYWPYGYNEQSTIQTVQQITIVKGYSPKFNETTQSWWEFDDELHKYIDTGIGKDNVWNTMSTE